MIISCGHFPSERVGEWVYKWLEWTRDYHQCGKLVRQFCDGNIYSLLMHILLQIILAYQEVIVAEAFS